MSAIKLTSKFEMINVAFQWCCYGGTYPTALDGMNEEREGKGGNINIKRETGKGTWRWSTLPYPLRISKQMPTTTTSPPPIPMTASVPSIAILIHVSSLQSVNTGKTARQWRLKIRWYASYVHIDTITKLNTKILLQFWLILNTHCFPEDK